MSKTQGKRRVDAAANDARVGMVPPTEVWFVRGFRNSEWEGVFYGLVSGKNRKLYGCVYMKEKRGSVEMREKRKYFLFFYWETIFESQPIFIWKKKKKSPSHLPCGDNWRACFEFGEKSPNGRRRVWFFYWTSLLFTSNILSIYTYEVKIPFV